MEPVCWVVFYHYVRDADSRGIRAISRDDFARQLDWLQANLTILDYPQFARSVAERRDFTAPCALLTFDDGVRDHLEAVVPELGQRKLSGVFFLNGEALAGQPRLMNVHRTHLLLDQLGPERFHVAVEQMLQRDLGAGWRQSKGLYRYDAEPEQRVKRLLNYELPYDEADRVLTTLFAEHLGDEIEAARRFYLSRAEVQKMSDGGMTFGYHTRRHRVLSRLDPAAQHEELAGGVELVRELTNQSSVPFCYPYGHPETYDADSIRLLDELGYSMAFTTVRQPVRPASDARFELPRFDTRDLPPTNLMPEGLRLEA